MVIAIILLCLGAVMSTVFIVSKVINYSLKTIIFKTIASLFFVAVAITAICMTSGHIYFSIFVILGLIFGLLGDVFLGFKYITTKTKKVWILLGMFAFALGHISYILALFLTFYVKGQVVFAILPFVMAILISSCYLVVAKIVGIHFGKMFPFGIFYLSCLTSMFSTSFSMGLLHSFSMTTLIMFFIGATFFITSDFMLTGAYFKEGKRSKAYMATYSVCYYVAQFLIAFSILLLK